MTRVELPPRYEYTPLSGKKILLGLTGSVAIYKSFDLARELVRLGSDLWVAMTPKAAEFMSPELFRWATGNKVYTELTGDVEHLTLSRDLDAMVIAPCTLNTMSKIAWGIGDNVVTLTAIAFLGSGKKLILVPAMGLNLYNSPQYRKVAKLIKDLGGLIIEPMVSEGKAKYPPVEDLSYYIDALVNRGRDLNGYKVLVTAGPTLEYIDPVRVITNPSSGYMGVLLALEFACRGAEVTLVHGPMKYKTPYMVEEVSVETTEEMAEAVANLSSKIQFDACVFAGAPVDYAPARRFNDKLESREGGITIELKTTPKVIKSLVRRPKVLVAYAAETSEARDLLVKKAKEKMRDYDADLIIVNVVYKRVKGFGKPSLKACMLYGDTIECYEDIHKRLLARKIVDWVANRIVPQNH